MSKVIILKGLGNLSQKNTYTDKFVEFQLTLQEAMQARVQLCDCSVESIPECRENLHNLEVKCLKLYNDMLTLVQKAGLLDEGVSN